MKKAMYPGTFDPITIGHVDVIERAAAQVDELHVVIATNVNKKVSFSVEERMDFVRRSTAHINNIVITQTDQLVVRYAEQNGIDLLFRGLRNIQDYENEYMLYQFNRNINPNVETMILFPSSRNHFVSSSAIKELIFHQADISLYVPEAIVDDVVKKLSILN
ncbi:MAG: pantetheine-phosphate adenylyltransferase [Acholeplasmataceae bacterium]